MTANDQLQTDIVEFILRAKSEFYVSSIDYTLNTDSTTIQGSAATQFAIPQDAIGQRLRDVVIVNPSNGEITTMPQLDIDKISAVTIYWPRATGYYLLDNNVVLYPVQGLSGSTIRLYYFRRPNELVATSEAGQITTVNYGGNSFTLNNVPPSWTTGTLISVQSYQQPFNPEIKSTPIVSVSNPTVTIADASSVKVGDWVTLAGQAVIPQVPQEIWRLLAQNIAVKILEALGDPAITVSKSQYNEMAGSLMNILEARVEGEPKKVTTAGRGILDQIYLPFNRRFMG